MNLSKIAKKLQEISTEQKLLKQSIKDRTQEKNVLSKTLDDLEESRNLIQEASIRTQKELEYHISSIATKMLQTVFEDSIEFNVEFVTRRNTTECDLLIKEDELQMKPLDSCGYGVADVASIALRISYWKLTDNIRNVFILDEPFRNLDKEKQPIAAQILKELSEQLNIQFIIVTHNKELIEIADKVFYIKKEEKESKVYEK